MNTFFKPPKLPAVPGEEGMGEIVAVGEGVVGWEAGQRVTAAPFTYFEQGYGTYQEYVPVKVQHLVAVPPMVSDHEAAQFQTGPMEAYGLLEELQAPAGAWLLHYDASSVLGRVLIRMAEAQGINMISVVRRPEAVAELEHIGVGAVLHDAEPVRERVMEVTGGQGAWAALSPTGPAFRFLAPCVRAGGTMLLYSYMDDEEEMQIETEDLMRLGVLRGWSFRDWLAELDEQTLRATTEEVMRLMADGTARAPPPRKCYGLEKAAAAVEDAQQESAGGCTAVMLGG